MFTAILLMALASTMLTVPIVNKRLKNMPDLVGRSS